MKPPKATLRSPAARTRIILPLLAAFALGSSACSRKTTEQARVDQAIEHMQSGQLVAEVEQTNAASRTVTPVVPAEFQPAPPAAVADPCGPIVSVKAEALAEASANPASEDEKSAALEALGACIRNQFDPAMVAGQAISYFKLYKMEASERPLSAMTDAEIMEYIQANYADPLELLLEGADSAKAARQRGSFSDAELVELLALVSRKHGALTETQARVAAAVNARRALVEHYAQSINRYEALLALADGVNDPSGLETAKRLAAVMKRSKMQAPGDFAKFPVALLNPYGLQAVVPDGGAEKLPLDRGAENPFLMVVRALGELAGPVEFVNPTLDMYKNVRDMDNPELPEHAPPAADAVRVAFIDSGIDWVTHPDLGLFLGNGKDGQISSGDYTDGDGNAWLPAVNGSFGHGSGTSATLLTIMAHYAPQSLRERKLDLAMWKVFGARELLAGPAEGMVNWIPRPVMHEAIIKRIDGVSKGEVAPKIVSVSMGFPFAEGAEMVGKGDVLLKAPWLWVMAAGNSGITLQEESYKTCFDDVESSKRVDGRILCVGALVQGIVNDKIASYSNYGDRVDVYAHESYIGLCPNGTSCSTPAVSGAAAVIAARYPRLSPEKIKQAIVEASEERELEVDLGDNPMAQLMAELTGQKPTRVVKVFNPPAMLPKALIIAGGLDSETAVAAAPAAPAAAVESAKP